MAFTERDLKALETCDSKLRMLFLKVSETFPCQVLYGNRTPAEQFEIFKKGRISVNGVYTVNDKRKIVTYCDGYIKLSEHNYNPSHAVDVAPLPIDWADTERLYYFGGYVMGVAQSMGISITYGGDWNNNTLVKDQTLFDLVHFELRR